MSDRSAEVAAALERWSQSVTYHQSRAAGDALAALLRESQPVTAPVVGDDEALLAVLDAAASHLIRTQDFELAQGVQEAATRLTAALADVARLTNDLERERVRLAGCGVAALGCATGDNAITPDSYGWSASFGDVAELRQKYDEGRAALAVAVAEEREACAAIADGFSGERPSVDDYTYGRYCAADEVAQAIRARAGRNDAGT